MRQLVYFSTAAILQTPEMISNILEVSRRRNELEGVTGLLIAGGNRFLQVIEGRAEAVGAVMTRIENDGRHSGIHVLVDRDTSRRDFDNWSMAFFDEPKLGSYASFQTVADALHAEVDDRLKSRVEAFTRAFAITPISESPTLWPLAVRDDP